MLGLYSMLTREWGVPSALSSTDDGTRALIEIISSPKCSVAQTLDILEALFCHLLERGHKEQLSYIEELIAEVNDKFSRAGFGFRFDHGMMMKADSQFAHKEIVLPALGVLSDPAYSAADTEYRKAHEHFRHGRNAECLVECCKAFESVMKVICTKKRWAFNQTDAASKLLKVLTDNKLFPAYMGNQLNHMVGLLEGTVPTVRNKMGGHGAGATPVVVDEEYAAFALHSTAADILLLAKLAK